MGKRSAPLLNSTDPLHAVQAPAQSWPAGAPRMFAQRTWRPNLVGATPG